MPSFCAVPQCRGKYGNDGPISFHRFPKKRDDLLKKWLEYVNRGPNWTPSKWSGLCSLHFYEEDFSNGKDRKTLKKSAIPRVPHGNQRHTVTRDSSPTLSTLASTDESTYHTNDKKEKLISTRGQNSPISHKIACRLCGSSSTAVISFEKNFEIYGMIQKCFPTINIQKDDSLPKDICRVCQKHLETFSKFIDQVLKVQSEYQRKLSRLEKTNIRPLIVKQEPAVRVKQERMDVLESFLTDDLDIGPEEACDQEQDNMVDKKLDFNIDFTNLNAQDIINNCDIMEIINLDDPFINIPDDDGTNINICETSIRNKHQNSPTAHELLQSHLLNEEHNYANSLEELKQEWLPKNYYKKEKIDKQDIYGMEDLTVTNHQVQNGNELNMNMQGTFPAFDSITSENDNLNKSSSMVANENIRSHKPIITSVSEISDKTLKIPSEVDNIVDATTIVNAMEMNKKFAMPTQNNNAPLKPKPNIVVLNESIVKSSSAFKLHVCPICQLKFVTEFSLQQHQKNLHSVLPMVSVPHENIIDNQCNMKSAMPQRSNVSINNSLTGCEFLNSRTNDMTATTNDHISNYHAQTIHYSSTASAPMGIPMDKQQQSLIQHQEIISHYAGDIYPQPDATQSTPNTQIFNENRYGLNTITNSVITNMQAATAAVPITAPIATSGSNAASNHPNYTMHTNLTTTPAPTTATTNCNDNSNKEFNSFYRTEQENAKQILHEYVHNVMTSLSSPLSSSGYHADDAIDKNYVLSTSNVNKMQHNHKYHKLQTIKKPQRKIKGPNKPLTNVTNIYYNKVIQLRRSYQALQKKFLKLQKNLSPELNAIDKHKFCCRICMETFPNVFDLILHKQLLKHFIAKPTQYTGICMGCTKLFRTKIALRNHMKYICQSLPLSWLFKYQVQEGYKCNYCNLVTFTHWRLYRRHQIKCQHQYQQQQLQQHHKRKEQRLIKREFVAKRRYTRYRKHPCSLCSKVFPSSNALRQHLITHTNQKQYKCAICSKQYKRRNGLNQHVRSYHMKVKPFKCSICQHAYALKCDMQRCRHSSLRTKYYKKL